MLGGAPSQSNRFWDHNFREQNYSEWYKPHFCEPLTSTSSSLSMVTLATHLKQSVVAEHCIERLLLLVACFFSSARDGFGPLVSVYLFKVEDWDEMNIGIAMASKLLVFVICCPFAGEWLDTSVHMQESDLRGSVRRHSVHNKQHRTPWSIFLAGSCYTMRPRCCAGVHTSRHRRHHTRGYWK